MTAEVNREPYQQKLAVQHAGRSAHGRRDADEAVADREKALPDGVKAYRTVEDLRRVVRAIATHFKTDEVVIPATAGTDSQAILVSKPGAPKGVRFSREIDAYPANAGTWQVAHGGIEASEEINALFGYGSQFEKTHGFYIDGVDERTAMLPADWRSRAEARTEMVDGRRVRVVAPCAEDLIVSKLARLEEKDREWVRAYRARYAWDRDLIRKGLASLALPAEKREAALGFVASIDKARHAPRRDKGRER